MRTATKCEYCHEDIAPADKGPVPKFCSTKCRMAAHRASRKTNVPAELLSRPRWVRYRNVALDNRMSKMPITIDGRSASSTNAATWTDYASAHKSHVGDGLGFVLNGDGIMCIDLDHCVENGEVNQLALDFIDSLPETYIEFSPSGDGLHIWGFGTVAKGSRKVVNGLNIETYSDGRYMTVTNQPFIKAPLAQLT
jgi:primase-polymerase (primpol)-like protein